MTEAEWRSLMPAAPQQGDTFPVPAAIADRFFRWHLNPLNVYGESSPLGRAELDKAAPSTGRAVLEEIHAENSEAIGYLRAAAQPQPAQRGSAIRIRFTSVPDVAEAVWKPPANVRRGVPRASLDAATQTDLWPWLAVLGGLGLLTDWLLYGRSRVFRVKASQMVSPLSSRIAARVGWRRQERKAS